MSRTSRYLLTVLSCIALWAASAVTSRAQEFVTDTLRLDVFFRKNVLTIDPAFRDNGVNLRTFRWELERYLSDPLTRIDSVVIRGSASPEGPYDNNVRLARGRAHSISKWLDGTRGLTQDMFRYEYVPENWDGLAAILPSLDQPWKDEAIAIMNEVPQWKTVDGRKVEALKEAFKIFEGGRPWKWLDDNVFPEFRTAGGGVSCIITHPAPKVVHDTVYVKTQPDTVVVFVGPGPGGTGLGEGDGQGAGVVEPAPSPFDGRKMILALRTNFAMIPFTNVGVELPLGEHWSIGADWYSPWIWREMHTPFSLYHNEDIDTWGWCFQFQAADIEARYWFTNRRKLPEQRLLGHSLGIYAAAGHYDFELNWTGNQGEFWNVGLDYLYAVPIFKGKMHMEFELGIGYIQSWVVPYECIIHGGLCYRIPGGRHPVNWFGPTRAQVSLVLPVYVKTRKNR